MKNPTNNIRSLRESRGLSGKQLAQEVRVSQSMISAIEIGRRKPSDELLNAIADVLGVSPRDLLNDDGGGGSHQIAGSSGGVPTISISGAKPSVLVNGDDIHMVSREVVVYSGDSNVAITLRFFDSRSVKVMLIDID